MKEIKPTNETENNPETEYEKEVLPFFFQTLKTSTQQASPQQKGTKVSVHNHRIRHGENSIPKATGR